MYSSILIDSNFRINSFFLRQQAAYASLASPHPILIVSCLCASKHYSYHYQNFDRCTTAYENLWNTSIRSNVRTQRNKERFSNSSNNNNNKTTTTITTRKNSRKRKINCVLKRKHFRNCINKHFRCSHRNVVLLLLVVFLFSKWKGIHKLISEHGKHGREAACVQIMKEWMKTNITIGIAFRCTYKYEQTQTHTWRENWPRTFQKCYSKHTHIQPFTYEYFYRN